MKPADSNLHCKYMSQTTFFSVFHFFSLCDTAEIIKIGTPHISTATIRKVEQFYVIMGIKYAGGMAIGVDPDQTAPRAF